MAKQAKQWGAIIVMIALFAMIAFVTNLCTPMATIIKNQGEISNVLAQIGNYGNFIAYLVMGIPAGMLIAKYGYKKTALIGLVVGIVGILIQWCSGLIDNGDGSNIGFVFGVYLLGAFISGLTMCILNCVVNPMLNLLGGGGNKGNQLIQIGGVFNSTAAVCCYILMGALIADATKAKISDATPALMIALAIFVVAFVVILFTKIEEPEQAPVQVSLIKGALKFRHFALGALAIFLYMGIEVGTPNAVQQYLNDPANNLGIPAATVGMIVAVYWFMMLVGRFAGAAIGSKVSSRAMVTTVSIATLCLVLFGMFAPTDVLVNFPGVDWGKLELVWQPIPMGIFAFLLVGLCTSVMWGAIFNMAVEGLGKYTAVASGIFMTMVFGCAVMMAIQGWVADLTNYITSFWVVVFCAAYILFYALVGSRVSKREE
ncbi:MAG: MFS transporter [Alloprevotella sp.]|nr:MFS transporter [Alloprevotella sp.]MBR1652017.1 MFS transporter [Alloprevotella sp.]